MTAALFGYKRLLCLVSFVVYVVRVIDAATLPSGSPTLTSAYSDGGDCIDPKWERHKKSCYLLMADKYNFTAANQSCLEQGAHLVSISDDTENQFIVSLRRSSTDQAWIGLYRQTPRCDDLTSCDWMWLDGSQLGYYNWPSSSLPTISQCVLIEPNGLWSNGQGCNAELDVICERDVWYPSTTSEATTTTMTTYIADPNSSNSTIDEVSSLEPNKEGYCPTLWQKHGQSCYLVMTGKYNFTYASENCVGEEGHLVSLSDEAENNFVTSLRSSTDPAWIGLFRQTVSCDDLTSCDWMWLDGSQLGYYNWPSSSLPTVSQCALIEPSSFWGNGRSCDSELNFICERNVANHTTSQETNHSSTYIGVGVFLGIIATAAIVGLVVYLKRCGSKMRINKATVAKKSAGAGYENVGMSSSSNDPVMHQPSVSIGDVYENTLTIDAPSRPNNHVDHTYQAYETVTHDTEVSPEYTRLQFT